MQSDVDYLRGVYKSLIEPAADFLASFRDEATGLPEMCWDLWEERRGVHTFTAASVWAGLMAAARFADIFGDADRSRRYLRSAEEIRHAIDKHLYSPEDKRFLRSVALEDGRVVPDRTIDVSVIGLLICGFLGPEDPRLRETMKNLEDTLWVRTPVGGVARYQRDNYYQVSGDLENVPGNPWFLCTMWLAQWRISCAQNLADLDGAVDLLRWCIRHALPSGVMAEQINPYNGAPISVSPLTWSHATYVSTVCQLRDKRRWLLSQRDDEMQEAA